MCHRRYAALLLIGVSGPGVFMGCLYLGERYPSLHAVVCPAPLTLPYLSLPYLTFPYLT